ncbi:MAG: DUF5677 domain-containing protein [Candidatus Omnitrophota bacterium]
MSIFDNVLDCGKDLERGTSERIINTDFDKVLAIFLGGSTRTLHAIKLLYENGFYEEGFSLARILLEAVIDLFYISLNKTKNAEQYIEFDKLKANEQVDMLSNLNASMTSQAKFSIKLKFKDKTRWSQLTFKGMLEEVFPNDKQLLDSHLLLYKNLCNHSHPSASGLGATVIWAKEDISMREEYREQSKKVLPLLSCQLVLGIYFTINKEFSLGKSTQITKLNNEVSKLAQN